MNTIVNNVGSPMPDRRSTTARSNPSIAHSLDIKWTNSECRATPGGPGPSSVAVALAVEGSGGLYFGSSVYIRNASCAYIAPTRFGVRRSL
ncbi:hypothetical protein J6590_020237 [Homalodisca vitripennis]|nr:hypothetical protein J6590_020237 [Homalodisca vitripennis]